MATDFVVWVAGDATVSAFGDVMHRVSSHLNSGVFVFQTSVLSYSETFTKFYLDKIGAPDKYRSAQ